MFRSFCITMLCLVVANAQPLSCQEDVHCSDGYFCATQANVCQVCLRCQDLNRQPPIPDIPNVCIKTINRCGPCAEGFINIYKNDINIKGKCVKPGFFEFGNGSQYAYVCVAAAVVGLLIVVTFMYIIKRTDVVRVVAYYHPVSGNPPAAETLVKYLLRFDKLESK